MHIDMVLSASFIAFCFSCSIPFERWAMGGRGLLSIVTLVSSGMRHTVACTCLGVVCALTLINTLYSHSIWCTPDYSRSVLFKCSHVNLISVITV